MNTHTLLFCVPLVLWIGCANKDVGKGGHPDEGVDLLAQAISQGDLSAVKELHRKGCNIADAPANPHKDHAFVTYTPLTLAIEFGQRDIVEYLLQQRVDVNATNSDGSTALFAAIRPGDYGLEMTRRLLDLGADPNIFSNDGMRPLDGSRNAHAPELTKLLLSRGAQDPFKLAGMWVPEIRVGTNGAKWVISGLAHGSRATNALTVAVADGNLMKSEELVKAGANINQSEAIDLWGCPPLSMAVIRNKTNIVEFLLDHGADINGRNYTGATPLMLAAGCPEVSLEIVRLLIARSADLNAKDQSGSTALDYATLTQNTNAVGLLSQALKKGR